MWATNILTLSERYTHSPLTMQNPNEDTEWNDVLRAKGILPPKEKEVSEDTIVQVRYQNFLLLLLTSRPS